MKPRAKLIYGPANSGKTERCIRAYTDLVCRRPDAKALFLAPTRLKVDEVKARIVASGRLGGIREPRILEFYGLAQKVIEPASEKIREISPLAKVLTIREIVRDCKKSGGLKYFLPISDFEGFYEMVGSFNGE